MKARKTRNGGDFTRFVIELAKGDADWLKERAKRNGRCRMREAAACIVAEREREASAAQAAEGGAK